MYLDNIYDNCLKSLNEKGFYCFENFLNEDDLKILQNNTNKLLKKNNNNSFFLMDEKLDDTFINEKKFIEKFYKIFFELSEKENLQNFKTKKIFKNLRVISQSKMHSTSYDFHFDAHQYTILVPIIIPDSGNQNTNGNLILFPNLRKKTTNLIINLLQKIFYQNKITKKILQFISSKKILKKEILNFKYNNIYIFNGFRSLHGNQPVLKGHVRATLLLHFYDVFENSMLVNLNRSFRKYIENKNIKKNINHGRL